MAFNRKRGPRKDLTGQRFGKLVVEEWAGNSRWVCLCDCGKAATIITANLGRNTNSCGCVRNITSSRRATTHGLSHTLAYKTWCGIKARCHRNDGSRSWADYGGKGIRMADEWLHNAEAFIAYIGQPPTPQHSLDRIDNTKGYEPGNIRWATSFEQANNKSNNRHVIWRGDKYTIAELARKIARECGIEPKHFYEHFRVMLSEPTSDAPPVSQSPSPERMPDHQ